MRMRWVDLLFAHWPMDPAALRPLVPAPLELDVFDGRAYLGIVPFRMEDVGPRGLPAPPVAGAFPELNVRTYVTSRRPRRGLVPEPRCGEPRRGRRCAHGVPPPVLRGDDARRARPRGRRLPVRCASIDRGPPARFDARYRAIGPVERAAPGSLEAWLTERRRLFAIDGDGRVLRTEIRHGRGRCSRPRPGSSVDTMAAAAWAHPAGRAAAPPFRAPRRRRRLVAATGRDRSPTVATDQRVMFAWTTRTTKTISSSEMTHQHQTGRHLHGSALRPAPTGRPGPTSAR